MASLSLCAAVPQRGVRALAPCAASAGPSGSRHGPLPTSAATPSLCCAPVHRAHHRLTTRPQRSQASERAPAPSPAPYSSCSALSSPPPSGSGSQAGAKRAHAQRGGPSSAVALGSAFVGAWEAGGHLGSHSPSALAVAAASHCSGTRQRRRPVSPSASLFGVGAPEALVIGVVALIVFGPKGLAEVARNLGKTLKTFQPTIRELQDVTREFRDTLQQEIGLDDLRQGSARPPPPAYTPPPTGTPQAPPAAGAAPSATTSAPPAQDGPAAYTADDMARITEEQLKRAMELNTVSEEQRKASAMAAWNGTPPAATAPTPAPAAAPQAPSSPSLSAPAPDTAPPTTAESKAPASTESKAQSPPPAQDK